MLIRKGSSPRDSPLRHIQTPQSHSSFRNPEDRTPLDPVHPLRLFPFTYPQSTGCVLENTITSTIDA
ncbi:hypothetical protein CC2G_011252 [Coprinopsis cinerea AmutBmut pab1-1]|nr:hypothetical protein CC2G_011252 [Coprinopsis cinerea AmutBmut pab1-1]